MRPQPDQNSKTSTNNFQYKDLRGKLAEIIGQDRWVEQSIFPAVEPATVEEIQQLLPRYPKLIVVVGSGSSFSPQFTPAAGTVILFTRHLREHFQINQDNQTLVVSAGLTIKEVKARLHTAKFKVPALARFSEGTVGGRLSALSSKPVASRQDGWIQGLLGLDVVLPIGDYLAMGSECIKDVAGYDLKHIFTGSRGNLGVIVKAVFRMIPIQTNDPLPEPAVFPKGNEPSGLWKKILDHAVRMQPGE